MSQPRARIKPGRASLIGGIAVGIAAFIIWTAIARELGYAGTVGIVTGAIAAVAIGAWIRIADL